MPGCGKKKGPDEDCNKDDECDSGSCTDNKCAAKKQNGDDCSKDNECSSDQCSSGKCTGGKKAEGEDCEADEDCDSGRCNQEKCSAGGSKGGSKGPKLWLGVAASFDATIVPGANNVCSRKQGTINSQGYFCVEPGHSTQFLDQGNDTFNYLNLILNLNDQVQGGFKFPANIRLMLTLDYAIGKNSLLGLRAGYVLDTAPIKTSFAPIHVEGRYSYLFGNNAVNKTVAPLLLVGVGAGEFDAYVPVQVTLCPTAQTNPGACTKSVLQQNTGAVNAWISSGPVFATAGGGVRFLMTSHVAATAVLKFQAGFGGGAGFLPGFAPEVGVQYGF
jgi:hypothetical protein